jgi:hypothetical protein
MEVRMAHHACDISVMADFIPNSRSCDRVILQSSAVSVHPYIVDRNSIRWNNIGAVRQRH